MAVRCRVLPWQFAVDVTVNCHGSSLPGSAMAVGCGCDGLLPWQFASRPGRSGRGAADGDDGDVVQEAAGAVAAGGGDAGVGDGIRIAAAGRAQDDLDEAVEAELVAVV